MVNLSPGSAISHTVDIGTHTFKFSQLPRPLSLYKNQPPQSQSDLATDTQLPINKKQAQATPAKVLSDKKKGNNHNKGMHKN